MAEEMTVESSRLYPELPAWIEGESESPAGTVSFLVDMQDLSLLVQALKIACLSFTPQEREANKEVYDQLYAFCESLKNVKESATAQYDSGSDGGFLSSPFEMFSPSPSVMLFLAYWHVTVLQAVLPSSMRQSLSLSAASRRVGELVNRLNDVALAAAVAAADYVEGTS